METIEKILSVIQENALCGAEIQPTDRINEDLGIDSLDKLLIVRELEDEFDITIEDEELTGLKVVQDIIDKLQDKIKAVES